MIFGNAAILFRESSWVMKREQKNRAERRNNGPDKPLGTSWSHRCVGRGNERKGEKGRREEAFIFFLVFKSSGFCAKRHRASRDNPLRLQEKEGKQRTTHAQSPPQTFLANDTKPSSINFFIFLFSAKRFLFRLGYSKKITLLFVSFVCS